VLFHPEDHPLQHLALRYALQYIYADPELLPGTELYEVELNMSQADSFSTGKRGIYMMAEQSPRLRFSTSKQKLNNVFSCHSVRCRQ
jgi:hypothetical protein